MYLMSLLSIYIGKFFKIKSMHAKVSPIVGLVVYLEYSISFKAISAGKTVTLNEIKFILISASVQVLVTVNICGNKQCGCIKKRQTIAYIIL